MRSLKLTLCFPLLCWLAGATSGKRILLLPAHKADHVEFFSELGSTLRSDKHEVYILAADAMSPSAEKAALNVVNLGKLAPFLTSEEMAQNGASFNPFYIQMEMASKASDFCTSIVSNEEIMEKLRSVHFDIALIDSTSAMRCMYVIPHILRVKYISIGLELEPWEAGMPALPSIEGRHGMYMIDADSSFWDRLSNTVLMILVRMALPPSSATDQKLIDDSTGEKDLSFQQLYSNSEMWITNVDTICSDFNRMHSLHYQYIAWRGAEENINPTRMSERVDNFFAKSENGVIVVTFGSDPIPMNILTVLLSAAQFVRQNFIVFSRTSSSLNFQPSSNVLIVDEVISDVFVHANSKIRLVITNGDARLNNQALYYGIPIMAIPMYGLQTYNGRAVERNGLGIVVSPSRMSVYSIQKAIESVIESAAYSTHASKCSKILRDLPSPSEQLVFWVNHVAEFGGQHLKPLSMDMSLWKVFMVDIFVFIQCAVILTVLAIWIFCRLFCFKRIDVNFIKSKEE